MNPLLLPLVPYAEKAGPYFLKNFMMFMRHPEEKEKFLNAMRIQVNEFKANLLEAVSHAYSGDAEKLHYKDEPVAKLIRRNHPATFLAIYGGASKSNIATFNQYKVAYDQWFSAHMVYKNLRLPPLSKTARSLRLFHFGQIVQLKWIADEISMAIGKWTDNEAPCLKPIFGSQAMRKICDSMLEAPCVESIAVKAAIPEGLKPYITSAAQAAPKDPKLDSLQFDLTPFVETKFGEKLLCNVDGWILGRDIVLLSSLREALEKAKGFHEDKYGKPLEYIAHALSRKWGPPDMTWHKSFNYEFSISNSAEKSLNGDIDVIGLSKTTVLVLECKDIKRPEDYSFERSFGKKVNNQTEGVGQARKALRAIRSGLELPDGSTLGNRKLEGIVVTQNHFSGEMWSSNQLLKLDGIHDISVIPLHQYLLVLSLLESAEELTRYFKQRRKKFEDEHYTLLDELEVIVPFLKNSPLRVYRNDECYTIPLQGWEAKQELKCAPSPQTNNKKQWQGDFLKGLDLAYDLPPSLLLLIANGLISV